MTINTPPHRIIAAHGFPLLFATRCSPQLAAGTSTGFRRRIPDSDLRGAHVLLLEKVLGFEARDETISSEQTRAALDDLLVRVRTKGIVL